VHRRSALGGFERDGNAETRGLTLEPTAGAQQQTKGVTLCLTVVVPKSQCGTQSGRDLHLALQALAYTILSIETRPEPQQEWSNKEQLTKLLHAWSHGYSEYFFDNARPHINRNAFSASVVEHNVAEAAPETVEADIQAA
jgi:hypothetical protein